MGRECFNCAGGASEQYTLVFDSGMVLEDKLMCEPCVSDFRDIGWIDVIEEPVLMRGGDDKEAE